MKALDINRLWVMPKYLNDDLFKKVVERMNEGRCVSVCMEMEKY